MSKLDSRPGSWQGLIATANFQGDRVILKPTNTWGWNELKGKLSKEAKFKQMTQGVKGLNVPNVINLSEQTHTAEVERASGINLITQRGASQGRCLDFFTISAETKIQGVVTYLEAIAEINKQKYSFVDHKSDSVFLDGESGVVTIVDADALSLEKTPQDAFRREWRGGMEDVINSFFTRGIKDPDYIQFTIPAGVSLMLQNKGKYNSAEEMIRDLKDHMAGKNPFNISSGSPKDQFSALAMGFNDKELMASLPNIDFSKMTPFQIDLMESSVYARHLVHSGEPQNIDKYALGYTDST